MKRLAKWIFLLLHRTMDTIVALSTPMGISGIGLIRLSGSDSLRLLQEIFCRKNIKPRYSYLGKYRLLSDNSILDEVLFTFFQKNASYTGEDMLEISCHGNPLILQQIIKDCLARGCRQAEPGEFTRRAFINGTIDLCQAEAVEDLIHARSLKAVQLAQKQLSGALSELINQFVKVLLDQIAYIEAFLDFPEEDLPEENRKEFMSTLQSMYAQIEHLIQTHQHYVPLYDGIRTVIAGLPNAGKSTLLNMLLGQERALVSEIPGTTRDFISEYCTISPYTLKLVDTAGLHETQDKVETLGIKKSYEQIENADIILWVVDGSQAPTEEIENLKKNLNSENTLVIFNKSDLGFYETYKELFKSYKFCLVSLKEVDASTTFKPILLKFLDDKYHSFSGESYMIRERHAEALSSSKKYLENALNLLNRKCYDDCLASELKEALRSLEQIIGKVDYECVLDQIFSKFCIGK